MVLGRTRSRPIGLDIGTRTVKAVQLSGSSAGWRIAAAASVPRADDAPTIDADELRRVVHVLERQGFAGRRVVVAAPAMHVRSAILDLPPAKTGAPLEQIARMELASTNAIDPAGFEMAWWPLPESARARDTMRVMACACEHKDADAMLDLYEEAGLEVAALDVQAAALARVCDLTQASRGEVVPLVDLGWRAARLVMLYDTAIVYERTLSDGGIEPLHRRLIEHLGLEGEVAEYLLTEVGLTPPKDEDDEAARAQLQRVQDVIRDQVDVMLRELRVSFSYADHQYAGAERKTLMLAGGGAGVPGLAAYLGAELGLSPQVVAPAQRAACPAALQPRCATPELTLAAGLAAHDGEAG